MIPAIFRTDLRMACVSSRVSPIDPCWVNTKRNVPIIPVRPPISCRSPLTEAVDWLVRAFCWASVRLDSILWRTNTCASALRSPTLWLSLVRTVDTGIWGFGGLLSFPLRMSNFLHTSARLWFVDTCCLICENMALAIKASSWVLSLLSLASRTSSSSWRTSSLVRVLDGPRKTPLCKGARLGVAVVEGSSS